MTLLAESMRSLRDQATGEFFVLTPLQPLIQGRRYHFKLSTFIHDFHFYNAADQKGPSLPGQFYSVDAYEFAPDVQTPPTIFAMCTCHGYRTANITVISEAEHRTRIRGAQRHQMAIGPGGPSLESPANFLAEPLNLSWKMEACNPKTLRQKSADFEQTGRYADTAAVIGKLLSLGADLLRIYIQLSAHEEVERKIQQRLAKLMVMIMMDEETEDEEKEKEVLKTDSPLDEEPVMVMGGIQVKTKGETTKKPAPKPSLVATQIWEIFEEFFYLPEGADRPAKLAMLDQFRQGFFALWKAERRTIHKFLLVALPAIKFVMMEVRERQERQRKQFQNRSK